MKKDRRVQLRNSAMPQVKKLVKQYSRTIIQGCLNSLKEYEHEKRRLEALKREVATLERRL